MYYAIDKLNTSVQSRVDEVTINVEGIRHCSMELFEMPTGELCTSPDS
jgi:hypothetical protein